MMPGDHVYYDDSGAAVPLATADTYAVLTNTTKLEGEVYSGEPLNEDTSINRTHFAVPNTQCLYIILKSGHLTKWDTFFCPKVVQVREAVGACCKAVS